MVCWETMAAFGQHLRDLPHKDPMFPAKLFCLIVLIVDIARRRSFRWPDQAIRSCIANIALFCSNNYFVHAVAFVALWAQSTYDFLGVPSVNTEFWDDVPYWIVVPLVVLTADFADYWCHRLLHTRWFWPIHSIHHSDPHVTVLTSARVHLFEPLVMRLAYVILLSWIGLPSDAIGGGVILILLHNMYVHINVDWSHGPLRYLIASPRFHRWHHANTPEAFDKNLANVFPFFDVMFGTYYVPGRCTAKMGADGVPVNNVLKLLVWPLVRWTRMLIATIRRPLHQSAASIKQPRMRTSQPATTTGSQRVV